MKRTILILSIVAAATCAFAVGQGGSGGGVIKHHGVYMSFYTAGLYVEPKTNTPTPEQKMLNLAIDADINYIINLHYLSYESRSTILSALTPSENRHYYIASPKDLTPEIKRRLLDVYQKVTRIDPRYLDLAAVTDTSSGNTYILPPFFKLHHDDQMAILFHESYWIMHPSATYNEVVDAEMAFQAAMQSPNDLARLYDFVKRVGSREDIYTAAVRWDLSSGALNGLLKSDPNGDPFSTDGGAYIPLKKLFGAATLKCMKENPEDDTIGLIVKSEYMDYDSCGPIWRAHLTLLLQQYPQSVILKMFAQWLDNPDLDLDNGRRLAIFSWPSIVTKIPALTEKPATQTGTRSVSECEWFVSTKIPNLIRCPRNGVYNDEYVDGSGKNPEIDSPALAFFWGM